ncbi:transposase [Verrucomicrobiaceae bacterium E54]|nr:transposase [Verrucomicrobiaceae bacterium E54]
MLARKADTEARDPEGGFRTYANAAACRECPMRTKCTAGNYRKLLISVHEEALKRAAGRLAMSPGIMRKRPSLVGHPFGTIKQRHGQGGLLCRGRALAGAEMGLSARAYNFTRVMNLVGIHGLLGAIRARSAPGTC